MKCPFTNSFMPRCQIETHPQKQNVEYCRVCGEWRYISDVGNEFPNIFWMLFAIAIALTIFMGLLKDSEQNQLQQPELSQSHIPNGYQQRDPMEERGRRAPRSNGR